MNTENSIKKLSEEIFKVVKEKVDEEASARADADSTINNDISDINQDIQDLQTDVGNINDLIPEDASSSNKLATEDYVDNNGGKIDSISINGNPQTIDANKNVDLPAYPEEVIFVGIDRSTTSIDQETLEKLINFETGMKPVYIVLTTQLETDNYPVLVPSEVLNNTWTSVIDANGGYWTLTVDVHELGAGVVISYNQLDLGQDYIAGTGIEITQESGQDDYIISVDNTIATKTDLDSKVDKSDIGYFEISDTSGVLTDNQYAEAIKKYCYIKYNEEPESGSSRPARNGCLLYKVEEDDLGYIFEYCEARESEYFGPNLEVNNVRLVLWKSDKHYTTTNSYVGAYSNISINNMLDEVNNTIQNESDRATTVEVLLDQKIEDVDNRIDDVSTKVTVYATGSELEDGNYVAGTTYYCTESSDSFIEGNMYFATGTDSIKLITSTAISTNPAITSFSISPTSTEYGNGQTITYNYSLKKYTQFTSLKITATGSVVQLIPSASGEGTLPGTYYNSAFTLTGEANGSTYTKNASITSYYRMFFCGSNDTVENILASLKDVQTSTTSIQTNTTNNSNPSRVTINLGDTYQYVYFIVPSTKNISYISSAGFEVPNSLIITATFTNHYNATYQVKIYRTDAKVNGDIKYDLTW